MRQTVSRLPRDAGIAIGPILFVLAILGIIAAVIASGGSSDFGAASTSDRITADMQSQVGLIRTRVNQCNLDYLTSVSINPDITGLTPQPQSFPYSTTIGVGNPIAVSTLVCNTKGTSEPSLWGEVFLPQPTKGFQAWQYIDATGSGGGRCAWIQPVSPGSNVIPGLTNAASKFTHAISNDGSSEVNYNPASASQKFVLWITLPSGSADSHCVP